LDVIRNNVLIFTKPLEKRLLPVPEQKKKNPLSLKAFLVIWLPEREAQQNSIHYLFSFLIASIKKYTEYSLAQLSSA